MKSKQTWLIVTLPLMFMKSLVTVGGRHFDPLFDIPIELPSENRITENYLHQLLGKQTSTLGDNRDIVGSKKNEPLLKGIRNKSDVDRYPVRRCLKTCKTSYKKCCKIFYKRKQQNKEENALKTRESESSLGFHFPNSVGVLGTLIGLALAGYRLTSGATKAYRENGSVSDPERKIFISAGDDHLDWIDKLKDFIHKDWNDLDVENVLCCIHVGDIPGLECYPQTESYPNSSPNNISFQRQCYNIDVVL